MVNIYANPSKFYILSLGFSDIEMKQGFIIGVLAGLHDLFSFAPRSIA